MSLSCAPIEKRLKLYAVRFRWAWEELVYSAKYMEWNAAMSSGQVRDRWEELIFEEKRREAAKLCETVQGMYKYLTRIYGGPEQVVQVIGALLAMQEGRRKTLTR